VIGSLSASDVVLENGFARAEVIPNQGARVRSLKDLRTGRELLYRRPVEHWDPEDYLATLDGGWDQMFPNDDPWLDLPVHGVHWPARFELDAASRHAATLRCAFSEPAVTVEHRYELLRAPRSGLRLTTRLRADAEVQPFLWSTHPMLAVSAGWKIEVGEVSLEADSRDPGRVPAGLVSSSARETVLVIPEGGQGWQEVLYAPATGTASVVSPDGRTGTRITWDKVFFRHLWVVTLSGFESVDLALVLEPCTTRPYRLNEAIAGGTAVSLGPGDERMFWSEVESLDRGSLPYEGR
jgi:hypothetical protein